MLELGRFLTITLGPSNIPGQGPSSQHPPYPHARRHELEQAIAEAWAWLEGAAYHRGKYDTAVFEAMKAVEVAVREGADLSDKDLGVHLMRKAFDKNTGPLTD